MTDLENLMRLAEGELRATGNIAPHTLQASLEANAKAGYAFQATLAFLARSGESLPPRSQEAPEVEAPPSTRSMALRLMFLRLGAHTEQPRWSSRVLDNLLEAALRPAQSKLGDLVRALFDLFAELPGTLSDDRVRFIREFGIQVVGRHRREYVKQDFTWLVNSITTSQVRATPAQGYLAAYVTPNELLPQSSKAILDALASTAYVEEVRNYLDDE